MGRRAGVLAAAGLLSLAGCSSLPTVPGLGFLSNGAQTAAAPVAGAPALSPVQANGETSHLISGLLARRSVLEPGPLSEVAETVLAANSRAAEAELRAAVLRSEAADKNWLPTLGPKVSLTNLGQVAASMVVDQVLFDNGRKKAEREIARADVEVAAVALSQDTNDRVRDALLLYLSAEAMEARSAVSEKAVERMRHFEWVMSERVRGGVSSPADHALVAQKLAQMEADLATDREAAARARAELAAMAARPVDAIDGLSGLALADPSLEPLSVVKAEAEAARAMAVARAARAGFLPGLSIGGSVGPDGTGLGLNAGVPNGVGFGMGASLAAVEAEARAAAARTGEAREEAARRRAGLEADIASAEREAVETARIATAAAETYDAFAEQLDAGLKNVPEVIGVFETAVAAAREAATKPYEVARARVELAAELGVLVDGDDV